MTRASKLAAWLLLAAIAFVTLSPVSLRPHVASADFERFGAFLVLGVVFDFAYAKKSGWLAPIVVLSAAFGLELLQLIDPTRDGRIADAVFKAAGGLTGCVIGYCLRQLTARYRVTRAPLVID